MAKPKQRATLSDLYTVGRYETYTDDKGRKVKVWLAKLGDADYQAAINRANAARARTLATGRNPDSDLRVLAVQAVIEYGEEPAPLIDVLANAKIAERIQKISAEVAGEDEDDNEWAKDGYLEALRDAWLGTDGEPGLQDIYARAESGDDGLDAEVVARARDVFADLKRFNDEVEAAFNAELDGARRELDGLPLEELRERTVEQLIDDAALGDWSVTFRLARLFYGTRDPDDHEARHFATYEQVERLPKKLREKMLRDYSDMVVDELEGKDLPRARPSSTPSGLPDAEADSPSLSELTSAAV